MEIIIWVIGMKKKYFWILSGVVVLIIFLHFGKNQAVLMPDFVGKSIAEVEIFCKKNKLELQIEEVYDAQVEKGTVIGQSIAANEKIDEDVLRVVVSKEQNLEEVYQEYKVNELGKVPIMMYHGIHNVEDTDYVGGNVDKDGYQRTASAFRKDLEFYYQNNYRMIRLEDYIEGNITTELGKSPIVLTFDDGLENNFKVTGIDEDGELIIDPNCAVGILEEFKSKYPDYGVTATFFVNLELFSQPEYEEQMLNWLVEHGYDIGNHTASHADLSNTSLEETIKEIGSLYQKLDSMIDNRYVQIVALPFGLPYQETHSNFTAILDGVYQAFSYHTISTLRVGWESELSPFHKNFPKTYLKRIRAYDNNGEDFDIEYNFHLLESNRYISDGDSSTIVVPKGNEDQINDSLDKQIIIYE